MNLDRLPDDCLAQILSFTSPRDACRISSVSSMVRSAADCDAVWEKFLPSDYQEILSRLVSPLPYSSKKELFLKLCIPQLIDGGKKTISLEKLTSKKMYMLSARELSITYASNPLYWAWRSTPESRFAEVAELRTIWWLEVQGKIDSGMLSPNTVYDAYLIVKFADRAYGLDTVPSEVCVEVGQFKSQGIVSLGCNWKYKQCLERIFVSSRLEILVSRVIREGMRVVRGREDGWVEIELGSFSSEAGQDVKMCLREVKGAHLKGGLIVEGIELRPKV